MSATTIAAPKRVRLPSVTTLLDQIIPKGGLPIWAEARGIEGALVALRAEELNADMTKAEAVDTVRSLKLGADGARDEAATRGIDLHGALEQYMRTGLWPYADEQEIDSDARGYYRAAGDWLTAANPEPVAVEQLVADPTAGYAGRLDLRAHIGGRLMLVDYTTSENAAIYSNKVVQAMLYERAARICGDEPAEGIVVLCLAADGAHRQLELPYSETTVQRALDWLAEIRPIDSTCESANRAERQARRNHDSDKPKPPKIEYVADDPSTHPGAMKHALRRKLPDGGLIEFEEAPIGWTTKTGTRRQKDWRAYWFTPPVAQPADTDHDAAPLAA